VLLTFAQPTFILMKNGIEQAQSLTCGLLRNETLSEQAQVCVEEQQMEVLREHE
jgi:hypothetical protein